MDRESNLGGRSRRALLAATSLAVALAAPAVAAAQDPAAADLGDVIVTGTKRDALIQDVPFSINAQTQEDIQRSGAVNLEDLSRNVAGLTIQNLGPGQSQVSVRGVSAGQVVRDQPGVKEQVGVYLDESVISLSLFTPDLDLFDLNRVETLRGPQGTLFGSGSVGGTIRYITNQPRLNETGGLLEGNLNQVDGDALGGHLKGAVNLPLGETLALRAVGYHTSYGGYVDALREGGPREDNVNGGHRSGGRIALLFQPNDVVRITPRIVYQEIRADGFNRQEAFNLFANPFTTTRPPVTLGEREQYLLLDESFADDTLLTDVTASFDLGSVTLDSVTSYIDRAIVLNRDASSLTGSVSVDLGFPDAAVTLPSTLVDTTDLQQFSQELRLSSSGDGPFQWLVGAFYSQVDRVYGQRLPTPGYDAYTDASFGAGTSAAVANGFPLNSPYNADIPYDIEQMAVFGEASYDMGRLTITGGANDLLNMSVDGISTSLTLAPNTYTPTSLAAYLQTTINGASEFKAAGVTVAVSADVDGKLTIMSNRYGSASKVDVSGSAAAGLLGTQTDTDGVDVAGTIDGVPATGSGQLLTAGIGSTLSGLKIEITGGPVPADRGTVSFSQGYADILTKLVDNFTSSTGLINGQTSSLQNTIKDIGKSRDAMNVKLAGIEKRLRAQFTALDTSIARMMSTSNYLTQQLAQLSNLSSS
ncbi:flagellar filament capping protein FliD [uncultured Brevundimonas sp.]|uniref:flagellar filament capping protein FliD n=1 Tax=uncultured Brevundimonas sp. TaxID=213418 RepID=UPI00260EA53E|nr:flagellar filament capping protein FliD [uncultured Brevundimonas sp.]